MRRVKRFGKKFTFSLIHPRLNQPMSPIDTAQFVLEYDEHHFQTIKKLIAKFH